MRTHARTQTDESVERPGVHTARIGGVRNPLAGQEDSPVVLVVIVGAPVSLN